MTEPKLLNPKTPREYLEALQRIVNYTIEHCDLFPEGDGETFSADEATLTDLFNIIRGCADTGLDCIKNFHKLRVK